MPKYSYRCEGCDSQYEIWHGMTEEHKQCKMCGNSKVTRVPSLLGDVYTATPDKVGDIVNRTIEETREEIKEYKKKLNKGVDK